MRETHLKKAIETSLILLIIALALFSLGCAARSNEPAPQTTQEADSSLVWQITIESSEVTANISSTKAVVEYGGDVNEVSYSDQPKDGNAFLLLLLNIDKNQPGKDKFLWSELSVMDAEGNSYTREENDTFLELHGLPRIKATDLSIGNNHGYVCFQIPLSVDSSLLTLVYSAENSKQSIPFSATAE